MNKNEVCTKVMGEIKTGLEIGDIFIKDPVPQMCCF